MSFLRVSELLVSDGTRIVYSSITNEIPRNGSILKRVNNSLSFAFVVDVNTASTFILFENTQSFPDNTRPDIQLKHVVGAFLHVAHGDVQGSHDTGSSPALIRPRLTVNSLVC